VHLDVVLDTLTSTPQTWAAVIDDERRVVGTIAITDIVRNYRRTMQANLRRASELGGSTGISEITVANDSPLVDVAAAFIVDTARCADHRHRTWARRHSTEW
jgi:CBS-domain-containing membrane protein